MFVVPERVYRFEVPKRVCMFAIPKRVCMFEMAKHVCMFEIRKHVCLKSPIRAERVRLLRNRFWTGEENHFKTNTKPLHSEPFLVVEPPEQDPGAWQGHMLSVYV